MMAVEEYNQNNQNQVPEFDIKVVKKLNHNANERDRRKKINSLYSSLRSLLPAIDQRKKLSNPSAISRALKYIPDLERQVKALSVKKEEVITNFSTKLSSVINSHNKWRSTVIVSASTLSDREAVLQITALKLFHTPLSHILDDLEGQGFSLLDASSHESFCGRVFFTLHLHV